MGRYRGLAYPIKKTPTGFLTNCDDISQLKSNMAAILLTEPGERVMMPTFGTDLINLNFNQPQEMVIGEARRRVGASLKKWEKRIQVEEVLVNLFVNPHSEMILQIRVNFIDPANINKVEQLNLEKFLGVYNGAKLPF